MFGRKGNRHTADQSNGAADGTAMGSDHGAQHGYTSSQPHSMLLKLTRVFQALCAIISLGLFSARVAKVIRLTKQLSTSSGAVEGILAAAVAFTILLTLLQFGVRTGGSNILRWLIMFLDIAFIGAFIAVAVETRPNGGPSGPCVTSAQRNSPNNANCNLPWGTFILAIISTILHFITAAFHQTRHHRQEHHVHEKHHDGVSNGEYGQHDGVVNEGHGHHNGVGNGGPGHHHAVGNGDHTTRSGL